MTQTLNYPFLNEFASHKLLIYLHNIRFIGTVGRHAKTRRPCRPVGATLRCLALILAFFPANFRHFMLILCVLNHFSVLIFPKLKVGMLLFVLFPRRSVDFLWISPFPTITLRNLCIHFRSYHRWIIYFAVYWKWCSLYYRPPGFLSAFQQYDDIRKEMESGSYCGENSFPGLLA